MEEKEEGVARAMRRRLTSLAGLAGMLLVGWFGGRFAADHAVGSSGGGSGDLLGTALFGVGLVMVGLGILALHEVGHLLAGRLAGMRPILLVVGPVKLERGVSGWTLAFNRSLALWGGVAASAPPAEGDLRGKTLVMTAGGPATSVLSGLVLLGVLWMLPTTALDGGVLISLGLPPDALRGWLAVGSVGSLVIAAVTLFPGRTGGFDTDGARILSLLRGGREADAQVALLAVMARSMEGARPRDWEPERMEAALLLTPDSPLGLAARQLAAVHHLDAGREEEAREHLEQALQFRHVLPPALRPPLLGLGAYLAAFRDGDVERGRALLGEVRGRGIGARHLVALGEAAVLAAEGDSKTAWDRLDEARSLLGDALDPGAARAEGEWIEAVAAALPLTPPASGGTPGAHGALPHVPGTHSDPSE